MAKLRTHAPLPIALLALFFAVGGASFAADTVSHAARLLTGKQIKDGSLTTKDVKNRSLLAKDFKAGQLPRGEPGPMGPPGADGHKGDQGDRGPAAANLAFDYPVAGFGFHTKTVGPWTFQVQCRDDADGAVLTIMLSGPAGDWQSSGDQVFDDATYQRRTGGGIVSGTPGLLTSGAADPDHYTRLAYTIELRSATEAATVTLNMLADGRGEAAERHCFGSGTAVLTG